MTIATSFPETICATMLAARLKRHRLRMAWSLEELAERAGVSRSTLHHLEHGTTPQPRLLTLHRVARALGIAVEALIGPAEASPLPAESAVPAPIREVARVPVGGAADVPRPPALGGTHPVGHPMTVRDRPWEPGEDPSGLLDPSLFRDWTVAEWAQWEWQREQLQRASIGSASTSAKGATLRAVAEEINRHRETRRQLQVLLHGPFAQVAERMIQTLFETASAGASPAPPRCA